MEFDVAIIGGGPAGMAAAIASSKKGAKTVLIERENKLGGILNQCIHNGFGLHYFKEELTGPEYAIKFEKLLNKCDVTILLETFVTDVNEKELIIVNPNGCSVISAKAVVMAMGCRERTAGQIKLTGTRPVGIYTAGQAQKMVNQYGKLPGKKIVILGSGDIGLIMARRFTFEGAKVLKVFEIMPESGGLKRNIQQCLIDFNIPLLLNTTITRVVGNTRVEGVYYAEVDESKSPKMETEKFIKCDCLIISVGLIPETELIKNLNINKFTSGAFVNEYRETNLSGIFSCGNVLHVHDLVDNVSNESEIAGENAALYSQGLLSYENPREVISGSGVRYTVPNTCYQGTGSFEIYFRVTNKFTKKYIVVKNNEGVIASKFVLGVNAGEMQTIFVDKSKLRSNITICMEDKL